jgi:hypothetical protein
MAMTITRKTVTASGWPLRDHTDMFTALTELSSQGWEGAVSFEHGVWALRLSASGRQTINATTGQWLLLDGELKAVAAETFGESYESDEPVTFPKPAPDPVIEPVEAEPVPERVVDTSTAAPPSRSA